MRLIVFSKMLREKSVDELIEIALDQGFDGYDLCVRPGYPVNPENATESLAEAAERMSEAGLVIPMVTAPGDLVDPDHPTARPILRAMDRADVRLMKLGYFKFDPLKQEYWAEVGRIRRLFQGWESLAREYDVKVCYHTHSHRTMGLNGGMMAHLIEGFDPQYMGAYLDAGHLAAEGEEFAVAAAILRRHLSAVAVKDVLVEREQADGHGRKRLSWLPAGQGVVDWTVVFDDLRRLEFAGPVSIHCEFRVPEDRFWETFVREIRFFRQQRDRVTG